jgi:predicted dehydrogenase
MTSRRNFMTKSTMAAIGAGLTGSLLSSNLQARAKDVPSAANQIRLGVVGLKGIGWANIKAHLQHNDVRVAALCDIDDNVMGARLKEFEDNYHYKPKTFKDYRKLLEQKDIDAVIINTPDHWHALQLIHACEAGKDVYIEKPLANYFDECKAMERAVAKYGRVVQVGQQQRSGKLWQDALQYVHSGKLGHIRMARAWAYLPNKGSVPKVADSSVPAGVDYDMWLGPAPSRPFNSNRFHFTFRWYWDYAGGLMTDWGVHMLDIALLGLKETAPITVSAQGGKLAFPDDDMETPDTLTALYRFNDSILIWEHAIGLGQGHFGKAQGVAFYGENATLVASRSGWQVYPEMSEKNGVRTFKSEAVPENLPSNDDRVAHALNFLNCIRSRETPVCSIQDGSNVAMIAQLGNIAYRANESIVYDKQKREIVGSTKAAAFTKSNYRKPYTLT